MINQNKWEDAPKWANYWMMDSDGCSWWSENPPTLNQKTQGWKTDGKYERALDVTPWHLSVTKRSTSND